MVARRAAFLATTTDSTGLRDDDKPLGVYVETGAVDFLGESLEDVFGPFVVIVPRPGAVSSAFRGRSGLGLDNIFSSRCTGTGSAKDTMPPIRTVAD